MLEGSIISAVPGEVCVFLEQLMQRGSQGGQTSGMKGQRYITMPKTLLEFGVIACLHW